MAHPQKPGRPQFSLRSLLGSMTWLALVIAICVSQQQAASRQRVVIERLKAAGMLPLTIVNGKPVQPPPPAPRPAPKTP
jgi:hypothetical protein